VPGRGRAPRASGPRSIVHGSLVPRRRPRGNGAPSGRDSVVGRGLFAPGKGRRRFGRRKAVSASLARCELRCRGALTRCRRRDSNPRHADYDSGSFGLAIGHFVPFGHTVGHNRFVVPAAFRVSMAPGAGGHPSACLLLPCLEACCTNHRWPSVFGPLYATASLESRVWAGGRLTASARHAKAAVASRCKRRPATGWLWFVPCRNRRPTHPLVPGRRGLRAGTVGRSRA
jgi:hypothetical protein